MAKKNNDSPGLKQIETQRHRRQPLDLSQSESLKTRERTGWKPQSEPAGLTEVAPA